ncbi:hypothetical protein GQ600_655 [Phytophthora cactorum]|nr:hypothetical protein GQ600_655 [Phytophthora cactorum]
MVAMMVSLTLDEHSSAAEATDATNSVEAAKAKRDSGAIAKESRYGRTEWGDDARFENWTKTGLFIKVDQTGDATSDVANNTIASCTYVFSYSLVVACSKTQSNPAVVAVNIPKQDLSTSGPTWFLPPELADWSDHDTSTNDGKLYLTTSSIHLHV